MNPDFGFEPPSTGKETTEMDEFRLLQETFGGWWCGVTFGPDARGRPASRPMRFCEAVAASRSEPIILTPELMDCPGGSRSLGWNDDDEGMVRTMVEKTGMDAEVARKVIADTPKLEQPLEQVTVGTCDVPDIVLAYAQPETVMRLLREWQRPHGGPLQLETSGFMSVCGSVAVKAHLSGRICVSFGCPDAREFGGIGRDRLVIGLPFSQVTRILEHGEP
jgi:uncharacterized protein (DUF169 family)